MGAEVALEVFERLAAGGNVILGQRAGIGAGVGDDLVALVKGLGDLERAAGGEAEAAVGLALQRGQIVQARGGLRGALFLFGDLGLRAIGAGGEDGFTEGFFPDAVDAIVFVVGGFFEVSALVDSFVGAFGDGELGGDAPEGAGLEIPDFQFAGEDDREGGSLHAADGGDVAGAGAKHALGEGAGAVDPDEPVALGAATGSVGEACHLGGFAEVFEGGVNALARHRLHPRALEGDFALRELVDISVDQLALAAGVAGVDDQFDVFAGEQFFKMREALLGGFDGFQAEFLGDDRQHLQAPEAVFLFINVFGHLEFHEMADGRGNHVFIIFVVVAGFRDFAKGTGEIGRHRRLLRDDECLHLSRERLRGARGNFKA